MMQSSERNSRDETELKTLVDLYEDGFKEIQAVLYDDDLTRSQKLDEIADIVFGDEAEEDSP